MTTPPPLTVDGANWLANAAPHVDTFQWTAVVAAAGKGARLGFNRPKILSAVAGRPILEWLLDLLLPLCQTAVFVLSPDGRDEVEPELERLAAGRYRIAIQPAPTGMGDAAEIGAADSVTRNTVVLWGDQVALRPASAEAVLRLHQGPLAPDLTFPTVFRQSPYIHFERDDEGRIANLLQAREGDAMPEYGESDAGLFCFRTEVLRRLLAELRASGAATGAFTAEFNLLPIIPFAVRNAHYVLAAHVMDVEETAEINSAADAGRAESFLRSAHG
jgi:bifunctional UDP-N-acetylglucosamine pyrophosphorylase / glucosamine-1-phosphate N-acetyltransferase